MAFMNLNYKLLIFEDCSGKQPEVRLPDISKSIENVAVEFDKSERFVIYSNEIKDIATTQRPLLIDSSTEFNIYRPKDSSDVMRLEYTGNGTAPAFRTNRSIGGSATTVAQITRVTNYVARIQNTGGTAWSLSNVQVNDHIVFDQSTDSFTSPFSSNNQNRVYIVQNKGVDFIDFVDNGVQSNESVTLGADFAKALKVLSQSPVKLQDYLQISGSGINPSNVGKFEITDVSDNYLEFINPMGVDEIVATGTNSIVVYEYLIGFIHLRASAPVKIRFGEQTEWILIDRIGVEALFIGSPCTHKIQAFNDRSETVSLSIQHAMVN